MAVEVVVIDRPGLHWTTGAPCPLVVASELRTMFSFEGQEGGIQTAEFVGCSSVRFGMPNDEALHGHPLYGAGLKFYAAHVIEGSPWLTELREIASVHSRAPAVPLPSSKHFLLAFHDSTLEAIALEIVVGQRYETNAEALTAMAAAVVD